VSFRNYSPEVLELAADAHRRGIDVVVITDSAVSPLARSATVAFDLGDASDRPFRSLVEPMCLAQALVVSVGHKLEETPNRGQARARSGPASRRVRARPGARPGFRRKP
jgi:DNA-binding MurR/RpiR family transcriptional regulator